MDKTAFCKLYGEKLVQFLRIDGSIVTNGLCGSPESWSLGDELGELEDEHPEWAQEVEDSLGTSTLFCYDSRLVNSKQT